MMRAIRMFFVFTGLFFSVLAVGQGGSGRTNARIQMTDSTEAFRPRTKHIKGMPVKMPDNAYELLIDKDASVKFLQRLYSSQRIWKKTNDPLREAIGVLLFHTIRPPLDTTVLYLSTYDYEKLRIPLEHMYILDSIRIIIPSVMPDTVAADTVLPATKPGEMFIEAGKSLEKVRLSADAHPLMKNDTVALNDSVFVLMKELVPASLPQRTNDTIILVVTDTLPEPVLQNKEFPFRYLRYPNMSDSIGVAVRSLISYLERRDSTNLTLKSETGKKSFIWLNGRPDELVRFWLPDGEGDSITVWIGSPERNTLTLNAEEGILFKKQVWHDRNVDTKVSVTKTQEEALRKVDLLKINPITWKFRTDASYLLSQGLIENWAKGGESNISSVLDITEYIDYSDKAKKITANSSVRFALGFQASGREMDIRKNLDLIEINSKVNHKAFGKFDLSGVFQFKTQALPGKIYPTDTTFVVVSKFFNPATLILGYGLDYKPNKNTSINFSPLSYKGTYVPDTSSVIKTKYGVPPGRKSKNEMGAYLTISNKTKLFKMIDMTNKVQFFSNFLSDPQNVDVDWEVIMTSSLNWFTEVRLNMHLIYDDNTLLPVTDRKGNPVTGDDGKQLTAPMAQFKELMGLSFVFKF